MKFSTNFQWSVIVDNIGPQGWTIFLDVFDYPVKTQPYDWSKVSEHLIGIPCDPKTLSMRKLLKACKRVRALTVKYGERLRTPELNSLVPDALPVHANMTRIYIGDFRIHIGNVWRMPEILTKDDDSQRVISYYALEKPTRINFNPSLVTVHTYLDALTRISRHLLADPTTDIVEIDYTYTAKDMLKAARHKQRDAPHRDRSPPRRPTTTPEQRAHELLHRAVNFVRFERQRNSPLVPTGLVAEDLFNFIPSYPFANQANINVYDLLESILEVSLEHTTIYFGHDKHSPARIGLYEMAATLISHLDRIFTSEEVFGDLDVWMYALFSNEADLRAVFVLALYAYIFIDIDVEPGEADYISQAEQLAINIRRFPAQARTADIPPVVRFWWDGEVGWTLHPDRLVPFSNIINAAYDRLPVGPAKRHRLIRGILRGRPADILMVFYRATGRRVGEQALNDFNVMFAAIIRGALNNHLEPKGFTGSSNFNYAGTVKWYNQDVPEDEQLEDEEEDSDDTIAPAPPPGVDAAVEKLAERISLSEL